MIKTKTLGILAPAAFCLLATMAISKEVPVRTQLRDPVEVELMAYAEAVDEFRKLKNPSPTTRQAHRQKWRDRFQEVIAKNPRSEFIEFARIRLLDLCNGLGEYNKSQAFAAGIDYGSTES
jgi:predicted secreted protein